MTFLRILLLFFSFFTAVNLESLKEMLTKTELEFYIEEKKNEVNPRYKLHYHITPPCGWMNGPNGFSYYKGEFHLFYQFYPYDTQWGPMHWGHVTTQNLVDWRQLPTALLPAKEQCYSGCAVDNNGVLTLMYTGHETTRNLPYYNETQHLAFSINGIDFHKYKANPVLIEAPIGTKDFRDPKIWRHGKFWYAVLGSKTEDDRGAALLYKSMNLVGWEFVNVLAESDGGLGFMWECPDFFEINGKYILLFSPQGMTSKGDRYKNTFQTGYVVGRFDYKSYDFIPEIGFQELDYGHDFYITQTTVKDGKRYIVAWFGMWEAEHPEALDGWVGAMTLFRELDLVGTRLLMKPVDAMFKLRYETVIEGELGRNSTIAFGQTGEVFVNIDLTVKNEIEIRGSEGGDKTCVWWDVDSNKVVVDRAGDIRQVLWEPLETATWRIFLDASSFEMFCGEGEVVFSSRVYPKGYWRVRNLSPQPIHVVGYKLMRADY